MYQHDSRHTGRSPYDGITNKPEVIWEKKSEFLIANECEVLSSIALDGSILVACRGGLQFFDPLTGNLVNAVPEDISYSTPLVTSNGTIYYGAGNSFLAISSSGSVSMEIFWIIRELCFP